MKIVIMGSADRGVMSARRILKDINLKGNSVIYVPYAKASKTLDVLTRYRDDVIEIEEGMVLEEGKIYIGVEREMGNGDFGKWEYKFVEKNGKVSFVKHHSNDSKGDIHSAFKEVSRYFGFNSIGVFLDGMSDYAFGSISQVSNAGGAAILDTSDYKSNPVEVREKLEELLG